MATLELEQQRQRRLKFLLAALLGLIVIPVLRLYYWQVMQSPQATSYNGTPTPTPIPTPNAPTHSRGVIRDRNGYPLALDSYYYQVYASPDMMGSEKERQEIAEEVAEILGRPGQEIMDKLRDKTQEFVVLASWVEWEVGQTIKERHLLGIGADPQPRRLYPARTLAAHLLGVATLEQKGVFGIEGFYNALLNGEDQLCKIESPTPDRHVTIGLREFVPSYGGCDLILTIDWALQEMVARELATAVAETGAEGGTVIVMDPRTGAILAMASHPSFDLNEYSNIPIEQLTNPAVSKDYEPGSVFKIVTMAAALDSGVFRPGDTCYDTGSITVGEQKIMNSDRRAYGRVSMTDILVYSLNVCAAYISTTLGPDTFYEYVGRFGFGRRTGIDLAAEINGSMRLRGDPEWHISDLGTNAFGQGIAVTPLQMITAVAAVANGGQMVRPYVVKDIIAGDRVIPTEPAVGPWVISTSVAEELTQMLVEVVKKNEAAMVRGYSIAGKTGTAQIPDPQAGRYDPKWTIASFAGYAPVDDPQFVVLVKLDKPQTSEWGAEVATPVFSRIAQQLFRYLDIPPDQIRLAAN
ncbi:MAG: peptidoglycan D,D-transpeptidase FtsI family protein [Anaerolineae bacterium]